MIFWLSASGTRSAGRVLTRGASEGCLQRRAVQVRPTSVTAGTDLAKVTQNVQLAKDEGEHIILRGETEHPLGAVVEDTQASESRHKKVVKFRPRSSHNSPRQLGDERDTPPGPFAIEGNGAGKVGLGLLADSKKGGRRYSMDDYSVNIAHRAELQTSQVKFLSMRRSSIAF